VDPHTLRCEIRGDVQARILLRPPLGAPLRSVTVNEVPAMGVEADSVPILELPAEVTLLE
jgi:hypothetical protein